MKNENENNMNETGTDGKPLVSGGGVVVSEQVLIRLILSGMYPIRNKNGDWMYFIKNGEYVGTYDDTIFNKYWTKKLYYLGAGQLNDDERQDISKVDYLFTDEYQERFKKWKDKFCRHLH